MIHSILLKLHKGKDKKKKNTNKTPHKLISSLFMKAIYSDLQFVDLKLLSFLTVVS